MVDVQHVHRLLVIIDAVPDSVLASPRSVLSIEWSP
jgi:hypothetical protein